MIRFDDEGDGGAGVALGEKELLSFIGALGLPTSAGTADGGGAAAPVKVEEEKKRPSKKERKAAAAAAAAEGNTPATDWKAEREARKLDKDKSKKAKKKAKATAKAADDDGDDDDDENDGDAMEQDSDDELGGLDDEDEADAADAAAAGEPGQPRQHGIEVKSSETPMSALPQDKQMLVKELKKRMLIEPVGIWHDEKGSGAKTAEKVPVAIIAQSQERAAQLLIQETGYSEQPVSDNSAPPPPPPSLPLPRICSRTRVGCFVVPPCEGRRDEAITPPVIFRRGGLLLSASVLTCALLITSSHLKAAHNLAGRRRKLDEDHLERRHFGR